MLSEFETFIPAIDTNYIKWGFHNDVKRIVSSFKFFPVYISGESGNGKTIMVEQICAELKRQYVRIQITPETDSDDLIGGFRLVDGETVFQKGPIVKAMESGAIVLIDEIDRGSNKTIMALQGILEGKPILIQKTGETVYPSKGFNVISTANTSGRGSDDGKYSSASIIDDAFLERFVVAVNQRYPSIAVESRILKTIIDSEEIVKSLATWANIIRKTYDDNGIDDNISTRRLVHIANTFNVFGDLKKAIELCTNRYEEDTREAFVDLFEKVSAGDYDKLTENESV